jgi:hypothetical protein
MTFLIHLRSEPHSSNASVSVTIAIRPKAKEDFRMATMLQAIPVSF